jgi:alcohol dehydrogenase (cytochrome c)
MTRARILFSVTLVLVAMFLAIESRGQAQRPAQREAQNPGLGNRIFRPVTDAMIDNPDPGEWLTWRRTYAGTGYSPLNQINKQNVNQLQLVWSWGLGPGAHQPAPLVHDGVMFIPSPGGGVQAVDAVTGDPLWNFPVPRPAEGNGNPRTSPMRSLAMYGDRIYINTGDARLIALDARTGRATWDVQVADPKLGYTYTSGPLAVKGVIISGLTGCGRFKKDACYITGHDAQTGKELWRTSTVARPGEPGGETWEDLPLEFRAGSDAWITGSYDPRTNLVYWGTAQAKPWAQFVRGTVGDALYTNSTLAIDPLTGKMVWYYQHLPGETHDMDETFERVLVDIDGRQSVFSMGKLAILWELDRKSGAFVAAHDLGYQTLVDIDKKTGKMTYRPNTIPKEGVEFHFCPSTSGFKSLRAMAYHPETRAFYIPLNLTCENGTFASLPRVLGGGGSGPVKRINLMHPESPDGLGEFLAMHSTTGKVLWRHRTRTPPNTSALATGGGLVFEGHWDRHFYGYDNASGKILYTSPRMPTALQGTPITYAVNGKQYLAMPVGTGGGGWSTSIVSDLIPEGRIAQGMNSMFVFALPDTTRK